MVTASKLKVKPCVGETCHHCGQVVRAPKYERKGPYTPKEVVYLPVSGKVTKETEKSVLFECLAKANFPIEVWVPRSQIKAGECAGLGTTLLMVNDWFINKEAMKANVEVS